MNRYNMTIKQENEYEITESGIINIENNNIHVIGNSSGIIDQHQIHLQQQHHHHQMMLQHQQLLIQQGGQQQQHQIRHLHATPSPNHIIQHNNIHKHNGESNGTNTIHYVNSNHSSSHHSLQHHIVHNQMLVHQSSRPSSTHEQHSPNTTVVIDPSTTVVIVPSTTTVVTLIECPTENDTSLAEEPQEPPQQLDDLPTLVPIKKQDNININIVCKICKENFVGVVTFTEHMKTHLPKEEIEEVGTTKIEMVDLSATLHTEKNFFPCAFCNKKYIWHKFLVAHSKSHKIPAEFVCSVCGGTFEGIYYEHMRTHIVNEDKACSKCDVNFSTLKALKEHVRTSHNPQIHGDATHQHKCEICGKHYKAFSYLREHQRIHTGEKPYTCDICGKGFAKYGCWSEHKKTHSIIKAYKCPLCPKAFTKRRYLKAHLLRHPQTVDLDKVFIETQDGEISARTFLFPPVKEKPAFKVQPKLNCPICFKEFKKMRYLRAHVVRHPANFVRQKLGIPADMPLPCLLTSGQYTQDYYSPEKNDLQSLQKHSLKAEILDDELSSEDDLDENHTKPKEMNTNHFVDDFDNFNNDGFHDDDDEDDFFLKPSTSNIPNKDVEITPVQGPVTLDIEPITDEKPELLVCTTCKKSFQESRLLKDHEQVHDGENPYKCKHCSSSFVLLHRYEEHMSFEHGDDNLFNNERDRHLNLYFATEEKSFTCRLCGETFLTENILDEHEEIHVGEEPFKCTECDEIYAIQSKYLTHLEKEHNIVDKKFSLETNETDEEKHEELDDSDVNYELDESGEEEEISEPEPPDEIDQLEETKSPVLRRSGRLGTANIAKVIPISIKRRIRKKNHEKNTKLEKTSNDIEIDPISDGQQTKAKTTPTTEEKKKHKCKLCGKFYTTLFYLREHLQIHSGNRPHKCKICGKTFAAMSCYREHVELHTNSKNHKCKVCGMAFAVPRYLKAHMRRHIQKSEPNGGKKFDCPQCNKKYQSKTSLAEHMKIHTGEAPFTCNYCGKVFMLTTSFRDHMLKHENVEMHQCPFCPKSFVKARYLQQHLVRHIQKIDNESSEEGKTDTVANNKDEKMSEIPVQEIETDQQISYEQQTIHLSSGAIINYIPSADGQSLIQSNEILVEELII